MTIVNLDQFTAKGKPITYTKAFIKLYNQKNRIQVHEIYGMVELEKWCILIAKHHCNLGIYYIVEISTILRKAYFILRDQERNVFYINKYINWDQFNNYMPLIR